MKIVGSGSRYQVFSDDVKTFDSLPVGTYYVGFNKMSGYFLSADEDMHVDEKVYGNVDKRVEKVLRSFYAMNRNMGVILSGYKGSGKTMFAKLLAQEGVKRGLPMLIVNDRFPDIAGFLSSIKQECIVLFDEFEKKFRIDNENQNENQQDELLTLFDGVDDGKKLFVVTCNDTYYLSDYLLNRPGRFHYHFHMGCVQKDGIREYLTDHLDEEAQRWIDEVIAYSGVVEFSYDILRAISFELNQGYDLTEAFEDLNIEMSDELMVDGVLTLSDGVATFSGNSFDINYNEVGHYTFYTGKGRGQSERYNYIRASFNYSDIIINGDTITVPADKVSVEYTDWENDSVENEPPVVTHLEMTIRVGASGNGKKVRHKQARPRATEQNWSF